MISLKQIRNSFYPCILDKTLQCKHDVGDYDKSEITVHYFCGAIQSQKLQRQTQTWLINSAANVRIYIQQFSLSHSFLRCQSETMLFKSKKGVATFCGNREPWKMELPGDIVSVVFSTSTPKTQVLFALYFHTIYTNYYENHNIILYKIPYNWKKEVLSFYPNLEWIETAYICTNIKMYLISVTVYSEHINVVCHDGPGGKSPVIQNISPSPTTKEYIAGSYQLYCVITKNSEIIPADTKPHLTYIVLSDHVEYIEKLPIETSKDEVRFTLIIDTPPKENVFYKVEGDAFSLFREYFQQGKTEALLELTILYIEGFSSSLLIGGTKSEVGINCNYGGISLQRRFNELGERHEEIWSQCSANHLMNAPIYFDMNPFKLLLMVYAGYSDGLVRIVGKIAVKPFHNMMLSLNLIFISFAIKEEPNATLVSAIDVNEEKSLITYVLQPYIVDQYVRNNFLLSFHDVEAFGTNKGNTDVSQTVIISFILYPQSPAHCARCYVRNAKTSDYIDVSEGENTITPIIHSRTKSNGKIEANVVSVGVDQSACESEQIWTLLIKGFTNLDGIAHGNISQSIQLIVDPFTIYRYIEKSTEYSWYLLSITKFYSDVIVQVNLDLSCLTTDVYVEHRVNNSQSTATSVLYKMQDVTQPIWMSGFDSCNIILVSENDKMPSVCSKKRQGLDMIYVKFNIPFQDTLRSRIKMPRLRNYTFYGMR